MNASPRFRPIAGSALLVITGLSVPTVAAAQEPPDTFPLERIVVTATKLPTPLRAVPAAVTVLDGAALRAASVHYVADALRLVPGLTVTRTGSVGGLTSLFVRGAESDHVQVLIDGVALNDPGGAVDLANLSTADVERIEVVRGPASVLYGSDAAAGVVQIFTRRGAGPVRLETTLGGTRSARPGPDAGDPSFGHEASASLKGGNRRGQWSLTAARSYADGVRALNNQFENTTFTGGLRLQPAEATTLRLSIRRGDGRFHFPTDGSGAIVDANQFRRSESYLAALEVTHAFGPGLEVRGSVTSHAADHRIDDEPDNAADTVGFFASRIDDRFRRQRIDLHTNLRSGRTVLTLGAAAERQHGESAIVSSSSFGPFEDASEHRRANRAGYMQIVTALRPGFTITAGTRVERSDRFGSLSTWRAGLKLYGEAGGLRLAAGSGFKEPTFYENFAAGYVRGNPGLEPERTRSAELGLERTLAEGRVRLEASAFVQELRNLIQYTAETPAVDAPNYFNVGEARATGIELAAGIDPTGTLGFDVALTLLRTRVIDAGLGADRAFAQGRPLLRRPGVQADVRTHWRPALGRLILGLAFAGRRDDLDFGDPSDFAGARVTLPAHTRVDLGFERTVLQRSGGGEIVLRLRADNVFDRRYEEIRGFPAPRRTIGLGITATTGF